MSLRVYNTLTRQKELFTTVNPGKVGMYLCGPTVYDSPHIGHMVGPVIFDGIKRYLKYKGYEVTWVVNITDVDDKLIDAANRLGVPMKDVAEKYTAEYMDCLKGMGIDTIDLFPKASEHMGEIIEICQRLIDKKCAYVAEGSVYFDVTTDHDYGKLSNRKVEQQEAGTRAVEAGGKRNPADFALWKAAKAGEPSWDSPWGKGRPGWHIECSAMSSKYLGESFDIHGGGMDLLFPHHENELAQSECAFGKTFVKYWLHNGLTRIKTKLPGGQWADEKMSKSLKNVVSPNQLLEQHGAELVRYLLLSTHYRSPIEFSDDAIASSKKGLQVFGRLFARVGRITGKPVESEGLDMDRAGGRLLELAPAEFVRAVLGRKMKFLEMMDDDFNTAGAIGVLHELASDINSYIEQTRLEATKEADPMEAVAAAGRTLLSLGRIIGLFRQTGDSELRKKDEGGLVDQLMALLIQLRQDARKQKNFALSDAVRDGLKAVGITLEDRADGTVWRKE